MTRTILTLLLSINICVVCAETHLKLSSRQISTRDGLPGNTINEMIQDPDGYIWMATNNGLSRYDGYATVNYTTLDNGQGEVERIGRIVCDTTEQVLWLSTAIYTNACYDLRKKQFVNWSNEPDRQLNKFFLSSRGMLFYGMSFGVRQVSQRQVTDYRKENGLLPSNEVVMILEDKRHHIWMPTDQGICVLAPDGKTTTLLPGEKIVHGATNGDNTYFLTKGGAIIQIDSQLQKRTIAQIPAPKHVNTSFIWQEQMMIFTSDKTYAVDIKSGKTTTIDISNGLNQGDCCGYHFIANESGRLWIFPPQGDMQSLLLIPNAHFSSNKGRKFHITADRDKRLFIATYGNGLFVWNPKNGKTEHFSAYDEKALFTSNYLTYAICDQQDNIWLGSEGAGAYCLTKRSDSNRQLLPEPTHKGDWANAISALASNPADSSIIIGTRWGGLYSYQPATKALEKKASLTARVTVLFYDRKGRLWRGTDSEGIYVEDRHYEQGNGDGELKVNRINTICEDETGRIWIGTHNGGLFMTDATYIDHLQFRQYLAESVNKSRVKSLVIDANKRLWIATNNGIYCTDSKKTDITEGDFRCYNRENGLFPHNEIFTLSLNTDSTLLVGASGSGMMKCRFPADGSKPTIERITIREGLPNNNVYSIVCDAQGNIWTGTEGGIACISPNIKLVRTIGEGSVAAENCAIRSATGDIFIGTINGLMIEDSQASAPTPTSIAVYRPHVTDLNVNGASLLELGRPDQHEFSHDENSLVFHFSDFRYEASSQTLYQYYLEGAEVSWQAATTNHQADYRDLAPGKYVFHLRSQCNDGQWQEESTYAFTILNPWYLRWWAWIIYLVFIALIVWYVYRNWKEKFDLHQQMKLNRQLMDFRARLFTNITHEFRTPLAIIKGAIDKLDSNQSAVQTAQRGTKRLLKLVNQFMEFRKTSTGHLRLRVQQGEIISFIKEIYQDFWAMAQQKDVQITFTPFTREYQVPFDYNIVETIVYNLLSNAVKYTPQRGSVSVKIKNTEAEPSPAAAAARPKDACYLRDARNSTLSTLHSTLQIIVEDTGPGISEEQQKVLFQPFMNGLASQGGMGIGLYTAYHMAAIHKGELKYERTDSGSCFTLTLPADDSLYAAEDYLDTQDETSVTEHSSLRSQYATSNDQSINTSIKPEAFNDQTIVIIEDDLDMKEQIEHEIGIYFHTKTFINGQAGYEGVKEIQPSLVICDVMLPDMNGYDIVTRLKQDASTAYIPIIMLTSLADEKHQIKAYRAGADDYMVKPCNWNLLIERSIQLIKWRMEASPSTQQQDEPSTNQKFDSLDQKTPARQEGPKQLITSQADKVFMVKLQMLTAQHMVDSNFSIDSLAEMMNMGRTRFFGRVKEMTGLSPNKYLLKVRMEKAADLLADGELNVSEVSYKVGIQDPSYFNKVFKSYYGVVPSKYERKAE